MKPDVSEMGVDHLRNNQNTAGISIDDNFANDDAVDSTILMNGRRQLTILHGNERYQLRVTTNDKLILTK